MKSDPQFKLFQIDRATKAGHTVWVTCRGFHRPYPVRGLLENRDHTVILALLGGAGLVVAPEDILMVRLPAEAIRKPLVSEK